MLTIKPKPNALDTHPILFLFGRNSRLPIDQTFESTSNIDNTKNHDEFVKNWQDSLKNAFEIAKKHNTTLNKIL